VDAFQVRSDGPLSHPLRGTAHVGGAKNSALKLMAASLLATGCTVVTNVPDILDVHVMARLLEELGCTVEVRHGIASGSTTAGSGTVAIDVPEHLRFEAPYDLVRRLRASISVLGPLVARCGRARVALPGGDNIGSRGLDMHMTGLTGLGAQVRVEHGFVVAEVPDRLRGTNLWLDFPSVGATENLLMAAVLAEGTTVIDNVAREPEIIDLCEMLLEMGAAIEGVSGSTLTVHGVSRLEPVKQTGSSQGRGRSRRPSPAATSPSTGAAPGTSTSSWTSSSRPAPRCRTWTAGSRWVWTGACRPSTW
jgi:UDP-N-acetylglucosamine 1-carboxyvinyltransferase